MKTISIVSVAGLLALTATAAPTHDVDYTKITYPKGTGENLPSYPAPPGGWANVDYSGKGKGKYMNGPFEFTSTYSVVATPDQVLNGTTPTGGLKGAVGYYDFGINSEYDFICFNIKIVNFAGNYTSPAKTATHIHQAAKGASGPPRLAFPNPEGTGAVRYSRGCLMGKIYRLRRGTSRSLTTYRSAIHDWNHCQRC